MQNQKPYCRIIYLIAVFFFISPLLLVDNLAYADATLTASVVAEPGNSEQVIVDKPVPESNYINYMTIAVLLIIIAGLFGYMWGLQRRFFAGCKQEKQMTLFAESPAGLPTGTIRSMIAFSIVILSLYFISLQVLGLATTPFPEALGSLLGAVIGFYFGSRSGGADSGLKKQIEGLTQQRDKALAEKDEDKAAQLLKKAKKGVALTKKVLKLLPDDQQKKYGSLVAKLEQGVTLTEKLKNVGMVSDAVGKAGDTLKDFVEKNPVKELVARAATSFKLALGVSLPQVALVTTIVGVGSGLAGLAYQKWKARILHAPFSPAELPLKAIDANTGFSLLVSSPLFKQAFMPELQSNDRPFMQAMVDMFVKEADTNTIYLQYKDRFESREQFEAGLTEFRHNAVDRELKTLVNANAFSEFGGYDEFIGMIDKIHKDNNALADLDTLVTVAESLQNEGEPVVEVFKKASEGLAK